MAELCLDRQEAEMGYLPPVCIRCGSQAAFLKRKDFAKSGLVQETKSWVFAPFCQAHQRHWQLRSLGVLVLFLVWLVLSCAGTVTIGREDSGAATGICLAGFVLWIIIAMVSYYTSIRAKEITATSLVLQGVSPNFILALQQHRSLPEDQRALSLAECVLARDHVRLMRTEIDSSLPPVCMRCGDVATEWIQRTYRVPQREDFGMTLATFAAGMFGAYWIIPGVQLRVQVPLCHRHRTHWISLTLIITTGFLLLLATGVIGIAVGASWLAGVTLVGMVLWTLFASYLHETSIRPLEIRPEALTLKGVSEKFVQAIELQRRNHGQH